MQGGRLHRSDVHAEISKHPQVRHNEPQETVCEPEDDRQVRSLILDRFNSKDAVSLGEGFT